MPLAGDEYSIGWFVKDYLHHSLPTTISCCHCVLSICQFGRVSLGLLPPNQHCFWRINFDSFALVCIGEFMGDEI